MDCVIAIGEDHRAIKSTDNYYNIKKICLENGYPIQYLSSYSAINYSGVLQKLDNLNSLQYILWNICVAIYSKVGGIPWILKNPNNVDITLGISCYYNLIQYLWLTLAIHTNNPDITLRGKESLVSNLGYDETKNMLTQGENNIGVDSLRSILLKINK